MAVVNISAHRVFWEATMITSCQCFRVQCTVHYSHSALYSQCIFLTVHCCNSALYSKCIVSTVYCKHSASFSQSIVFSVLHSQCIILTVHCFHSALLSDCIILTVHYSNSALYSQCIVLTLHCTHSASYSEYIVNTVHCKHSALYSQCIVPTVHCTHSALYSEYFECDICCNVLNDWWNLADSSELREWQIEHSHFNKMSWSHVPIGTEVIIVTQIPRASNCGFTNSDWAEADYSGGTGVTCIRPHETEMIFQIAEKRSETFSTME